MIPLEDNFNDVIGKAQRGLKLTDEQLAQKAGVTGAELARAKAGEFNEPVIAKLAPVLHLGKKQLVALGKKAWRPMEQGLIKGLQMFTTTYGDMTVNSFIVWDPKSREAAVFDTGADSSGMLQAIKNHDVVTTLILLTHTHPDHVADLAKLTSTTHLKAWVCEQEPVEGAQTFKAGKKFQLGTLQIETRQTSGHSKGGITYYITGLEKPIAVVGDSIFASSMGGGMVSYEDALRNNREQILTMPDETIICPGHGPLTTVGEEKANNPFFTA